MPAWDAALCIGGEPLQAEESLDVAGVRIDVLHTPGHTADSVSLVLPDGPVDGPASGSALTGDTILGRGTIIAQPDGSLAAYLASLEVLRDVGSGVIGLPAHGPVVPDLATTAQRYLKHRQRLAEVEAALVQRRHPGIPRSGDGRRRRGCRLPGDRPEHPVRRRGVKLAPAARVPCRRSAPVTGTPRGRSDPARVNCLGPARLFHSR